jgi:cell division protein FtsA
MDILTQIQKTISESGYEKRIRAGIVLTGGGAALRHIKELCQYTLLRNSRIGVPDIGFVNSIPSELKNPMFATSLGLLKHGATIKEFEFEEDSGKERKGGEVKKKKSEEVKGRKGGEDKGGEDNGGKKKDKGNSIWDSVTKWLDDLTEKTS